MTAVGWDEVKRLAADFQRAQLSSTVQRLSERNCVELVTKLIEQKLLDVVFTSDGKEYVTPQQLTKEIRDELYVNGGRINLVELSKVLNVDLSQVSVCVAEVERSDSNFIVILGQLIDKSYLQRIAQEIDEKLSHQGQVIVGDLTRQYDLPSDFLQTVIERQLGKLIHGKQDKTDPQVFFTDAFVARNRACLRGALMAATRPTSVVQLLAQSGVQEGLFYSIINSLIEMKQIPGMITGKQSGNSVYIPAIYSKSQNDWVNNFYRQNGYLEYDALLRLGISDPQGFVHKHFPTEKLLLLKTCAVGKQLVSQVEAALEEAVVTGLFLDILDHLPSAIEHNDGNTILNDVLKTLQGKNPIQNVHVFCRTVAMSDKFLQTMSTSFENIIQRKAEEAVCSGAFCLLQAEGKLQSGRSSMEHDDSSFKSDRKEERRRKATGGKGGGGTQGRETKTKSTKKKYMRGKGAFEDSDEESMVPSACRVSKHTAGKIEFLSLKEILDVLKVNEELQDESYQELREEVAHYLYPCLNKAAFAAAQVVFEKSNPVQNRRKMHSDLQEKLNSLVSNIRLFEKGIKQFGSDDLQIQLAKYLLKSLCTDITNDIFGYVAQENTIQYDQGKEMSSEMRVKIINEVPNEVKEPISKLHKSLNGLSVDDFLTCVEVATGPGICDMVIRKTDKKKERPQVFGHRQALLEQLATAQDPAVVLHLTTLVLFQTATQTILHASGRFVSNIISFLQAHLPAETYNTLQRYHDLVLKLLTTDSNESCYTEVVTSLQNEMSSIKEIAMLFKKQSTEKSQATLD